MNLKETEKGVVIKVIVKFNTEKFKVTVNDSEIKVFCTEQPIKGRVNKELIKELSKLFHAKVELVSGFTSRQKRLLVVGVGKSEAENLLHVK